MKFALSLLAFAAAVNAFQPSNDDIDFLMLNREAEAADPQPSAKTGMSLFPRGPIKQARHAPKAEEPVRTDPKEIAVGEEREIPSIVFNERPHGPFYDWRDWAPESQVDPYDVCDFPETDHFDTPDYQALPALCKTEMIWRKVLQDDLRERFYTGDEFQSLFDQDMNLSYDTLTDSMPVNRVKVTHPVGVTSKIEYISHPDSPYTGLFRGAKHGIMRISDTTKTVPHVAKTSPGFGIKFLRDGMASGNSLAMFSFDGQTSFNFFKNRWTTILREFQNLCARETIGKKLAGVTDHIGATSVMEMAQFDQYGHEEEEPHWPFEVNYEPYDVYGWTDEWQNDFRDQIEAIPPNTSMFKVFAYDTPADQGGEDKLIGWIVSRSTQRSSFWGDRQLYFQHRRMDDDIKYRPHYFEWLEFWDNGKHDETPLKNPAPMQKCPFMFLFHNAGLM